MDSATAGEPLSALVIGVTGTREIVSGMRFRALDELLTRISARHKSTTVVHGVCTGFDSVAHRIAWQLGLAIEGRPGVSWDGESPHRADLPAEEFATLYPPELYRDRNFSIARQCDILIAGPAYPQYDFRSRRSGTWQTVRFARDFGKPIHLLYDDGEAA